MSTAADPYRTRRHRRRGPEGAEAPLPSRTAVLWLVPLLLLLHNVEEALFIGRVLPGLRDRAPAVLADLLPTPSVPEFLAALLVVTAIPFLVAVRGDLERTGGPAVYLLLAVQAVLLLNVFSHLAGAWLLTGYAPGLATALALNLPFSIHLFRRALRERWLSGRAFASLLPLAFLLHGPGLLALFHLVRMAA